MTAEKDNSRLDDASARFVEFLKSRRMRKTPERFTILETACRLGRHFDAEELYEQLEHDAYHVSRVTVYSTLDLLCEAGILSCERFGGRLGRYEFNDTSHIHLVCTGCGKIREVADPEIMRQLTLRRYGSFVPSKISIDIFGLCGNCSRQSRKHSK